MTGRIRVLVSLTVLVLAVTGVARSATPPALVCKLPRDSTGTLPPTARHGIVNHLPQYPTVSLASPRQQARARRILTELVAAADSREVARCTGGDPSGLRHAFPRSTKRRHERLLLPRRAPRGAARANDLRLHATEGAHLRQRSRQAARPRRRDVEHTGRRGRADTRRADPSLALTHRLQGREETGVEASGERRLPYGLTTPAGCERDAPRLVHRRAAQRIRDHRSAA